MPKPSIPGDPFEKPEERTHPTSEPATVAHREDAESVAAGSASVIRDSIEPPIEERAAKVERVFTPTVANRMLRVM